MADLAGDQSGSITANAAPQIRREQLTVLALLGTVSMLFAGFASAYLVRRAGTDWQRVLLPQILWFNTGVLLISSWTLEAARSAHRKGSDRSARSWLTISISLGLLFIAGQVMGWHQLAAEGFYLASNPYNSFFYVLTSLHAAHLFSGIIALSYVLWRAFKAVVTPGLLDSCSTYWHFVDGLWLLIFFMLLVY